MPRQWWACNTGCQFNSTVRHLLQTPRSGFPEPSQQFLDLKRVSDHVILAMTIHADQHLVRMMHSKTA
jgi:hypothetical protein